MFSWFTSTPLWLGCEKAPEARAFDRLVGLIPVSSQPLVSLSYEETRVQTLPLHSPPPPYLGAACGQAFPSSKLFPF